MQTETLEGGFNNAPIQTSHAFRALMNVMARPGTIEAISGALPPAPLSVAAGTLLLTLADPDTPIYLAEKLDSDTIRAWIAFHCGAPITGPAEAVFAFGRWEDLAPLNAYPVGNPEYPDRSTTLIVESEQLENNGATLSGPGILSEASLNLPELAAFQANAALFPLGLDFYFTSGKCVAALPRSTRVS